MCLRNRRGAADKAAYADELQLAISMKLVNEGNLFFLKKNGVGISSNQALPAGK
jgi:hypothetical protein